MNISEEDLAVAGLAKLVGSELHAIDTYTTQSTNGPANKIDPRSFITGRAAATQNRAVSHGGQKIVKHNGQTFYAGVDESLVASLHPDPPSTVPQLFAEPAAPAAPVRPVHINRDINREVSVKVQPSPTINTELSDTLIKTLKSIDKTLKTIAKSLQPENK